MTPVSSYKTEPKKSKFIQSLTGLNKKNKFYKLFKNTIVVKSAIENEFPSNRVNIEGSNLQS